MKVHPSFPRTLKTKPGPDGAGRSNTVVPVTTHASRPSPVCDMQCCLILEEAPQNLVSAGTATASCRLSRRNSRPPGGWTPRAGSSDLPGRRSSGITETLAVCSSQRNTGGPVRPAAARGARQGNPSSCSPCDPGAPWACARTFHGTWSTRGELREDAGSSRVGRARPQSPQNQPWTSRRSAPQTPDSPNRTVPTPRRGHCWRERGLSE